MIEEERHEDGNTWQSSRIVKPMMKLGRMKKPWMGFHGFEDEAIQDGNIEKLWKRYDNSNVWLLRFKMQPNYEGGIRRDWFKQKLGIQKGLIALVSRVLSFDEYSNT